VPEDVIERSEPQSSEGRIGVTETAKRLESDPAWWQVRSYLVLDSAAGTSADAAATVRDALVAEGWSSDQVRVIDERLITDGFRKTIDDASWYIEVDWNKSAEGKAETLSLLVVTPTTTRGDWKGF
jgi:hypothetical protein